MNARSGSASRPGAMLAPDAPCAVLRPTDSGPAAQNGIHE